MALEIVENRLPKVLKKYQKDLIKIENEIITNNYLNLIFEEINEDLQ